MLLGQEQVRPAEGADMILVGHHDEPGPPGKQPRSPPATGPRSMVRDGAARRQSRRSPRPLERVLGAFDTLRARDYHSGSLPRPRVIPRDR
jgi:hypothetical protein